LRRIHLATLVLFVLASNIFSQESGSKILFLDFKFVNEKPSLVGMAVVEGKLKARNTLLTSNYGIQYSVISTEDKVLYNNLIDDPSECVYEYPAGEGKIGRASIKKDTINFSLRVPYSSSIEKIRMNVLRSSSKLNKSQTQSNGFEFTIDHNRIQFRK
jgi:hypothetical protein